MRPPLSEHLQQLRHTDGKDLIYEGIATFSSSLAVLIPDELDDGKDLIYEGIATPNSQFPVFLLFVSGRKRPDLRRDCDTALFVSVFALAFDGKDLIYEGIATLTLNTKNRIS